MLKYLLAALFFLPASFVQSEELSLRDELSSAQAGSYLVLEQNKAYTFLYILNRKTNLLALEEVIIPASSFARNQMSFREWFENGAPGHTSWTLTQINLMTGQFEKSYSFSLGRWIDLSDEDQFLTTLLNLRFTRISDADRRHIGLPPGYGKPDYRPLWQPRLIVDGTWIKNVPFSAWKTRWPRDGSELSGKILEVYLPDAMNDTALPAYPTFFPYWIEVEGKLGSAKIRVIDSGMNAHSPENQVSY